MNSQNKIFCLFLVFFIATQFVFAEHTLSPSVKFQLETLEEKQILPQLSWIIEEGQNTLTIDDLTKNNWKGGRLIELNNNQKFTIEAHKYYWYHLQLTNDLESSQMALEFIREGDCWPWEFTLKTVEAFIINEEGNTTKAYSGSGSPASQRDYPKTLSTSMIRLNMLKNEVNDIWIRIANAETCDVQINMTLIDQLELNNLNPWDIERSRNSLLYGAVISIFFISLFLYLWSRETIYLWFLLYQIAVLLASICTEYRDEAFELFFSEKPRLFGYVFTFLDVAKFTILVQFGRVYIDTKSKFPRIHKLLGLGMYVFTFMLIMGILSRSFPNMPNTFWTAVKPAMLGIVLFSIVIGYLYLIFSKDKFAQFYCVGAIIPFVILLITLIIYRVEHYVVVVGFIIDGGMVLTMTLVLAYRFRLISNQREQAITAKLLAESDKLSQLEQINIASNKFVPQTFLNFLGKQNILDATLGDYVEKQVTVLFSDIRDYTTISEQMTPEENFRFVNAFNQRMGPVIQSHQGFVNQYLGDGIMAVFPEEAEETLCAAIAMQHTLRNYNQDRVAKDQIPIKMGIGVHTGSLIMGIIGDEQRMDAATISDTVNVASRIESLTKLFGVNILLSEESFNKIENKEKFRFRYLGKNIVKGKKQAIGVYECFDGDDPAQIKRKKESLSIFESALKLYFDKEFEKAITSFEAVLKINRNDVPADLFLNKAKRFLANQQKKKIV